MSFILAIIILAICCLLMLVWEFLPIILVVAAVCLVVGVIICCSILRRYETKVVETKIIDEKPIIERRAEETGYTISYGRSLSGHRHYRYKDVQVGEEIKFEVTWIDGKVSYVTCKRGSETFKRLYRKLKK